MFSLKNARQRRHCRGNLWTHKGVTVSSGCQRHVTAGWFESMKNALPGDRGRTISEEGGSVSTYLCVCLCVKALTHFSLLHLLLSILQTIGLYPQSGRLSPSGVMAILFSLTSCAKGKSKSLPNWMLTVKVHSRFKLYGDWLFEWIRLLWVEDSIKK